MNSYVPKDDFGLLVFLPLPPECRYYRCGTNFPGSLGRSGISLWDPAVEGIGLWDPAVEAPRFPSPLLFREPVLVCALCNKVCDFLVSTVQANMELGEVKGSPLHAAPSLLCFFYFETWGGGDLKLDVQPRKILNSLVSMPPPPKC